MVPFTSFNTFLSLHCLTSLRTFMSASLFISCLVRLLFVCPSRCRPVGLPLLSCAFLSTFLNVNPLKKKNVKYRRLILNANRGLELAEDTFSGLPSLQRLGLSGCSLNVSMSNEIIKGDQKILTRQDALYIYLLICQECGKGCVEYFLTVYPKVRGGNL